MTKATTENVKGIIKSNQNTVLNEEKKAEDFINRYTEALHWLKGNKNIAWISTHEVYEGDEFQYSYGLDEAIIHIPCGEDREDMVSHFYSCYKLKDGEKGFIVINKIHMKKILERENLHEENDYISMGFKVLTLKLMNHIKKFM